MDNGMLYNKVKGQILLNAEKMDKCWVKEQS